MVPQSYERLAWNLDVYIAIAAGNSGTKNRILRSESKLTSREAEKYPRKRFESPRDIKFTKEKTVRTSEMVLATPHRVWGAWTNSREFKNIRKPLLQPYKGPPKGVGVDERREISITKLVKAIDVAEQLASEAKMTSEKGMADTTKARYYHLLAYLV